MAQLVTGVVPVGQRDGPRSRASLAVRGAEKDVVPWSRAHHWVMEWTRLNFGIESGGVSYDQKFSRNFQNVWEFEKGHAARDSPHLT